MSKSLVKTAFAATAIAAVGMFGLGGTTPAWAAYDVQVYDDGVLQAGITVFVTGNSLVFSGSTTHFAITNGAGTSNNPGNVGGSNLDLSSNEEITTTFGASGGTNTIQIVLSQTGFNEPTGTRLQLSSSGGGGFGYVQGTNPSATGSVSSTYQGFLDPTNTINGQPAGSATPTQTASSGSQTTVGTTPLVYSPGTATNLVTGATPFSLTDVLTFTFTLGAGSGQDTANASFQTDVSAVPEPASLILLGSGLLGMGVLRRRRRQV